MSADGTLREQLTEVTCGCGAMHRGNSIGDRLLIVLHSLADEDFDWDDADEFRDALLPVVESYAAQKAAEELRAAAEVVHRQWDDDADVWPWDELTARAAALSTATEK